MGLLDSLTDVMKGAFGQAEASALPAILSQVLAKTDMGSAGGLLARLQQGGLGEEVASWLSNGSNLPISADQLRSALGNEQVQQIARAAGLPVDKLLGLLSEKLPETIDTMSPNGELQEN